MPQGRLVVALAGKMSFQGILVVHEIGAIVLRLGLDQNDSSAALAMEKEIDRRFESQVAGKLEARREELLRRFCPFESEMRGDARLAAVRADNQARCDCANGSIRHHLNRALFTRVDGPNACSAPDLCAGVGCR